MVSWDRKPPPVPVFIRPAAMPAPEGFTSMREDVIAAYANMVSYTEFLQSTVLMIASFHMALQTGVPYKKSFGNWCKITSALIAAMGMMNSGIEILASLPFIGGHFVIPRAIQDRMIKFYPSSLLKERNLKRVAHAAQQLGMPPDVFEAMLDQEVNRIIRTRTLSSSSGASSSSTS